MTVNNYVYGEIIRIYEQELDRKSSLEAKASYYLGVISLIMTLFFDLMMNINGVNLSCVYILLGSCFVVCGMCALCNCILIIKVKDVPYPIEINDIYKLYYLKCYEENKLKNVLFQKYLASIRILSTGNDISSKKLKYTNILLIILIVLLISIMVVHYGYGM